MPAKSKSQQRLMGWVYACKTGKAKNCPKNIKKVAKGISTKDARKFAKTKRKGLREMNHPMSLIDYLQEMGEKDSAWIIGGDAPRDNPRPTKPVDNPEQDADARRARLGALIMPKKGDLIQSQNSNYIVLSTEMKGLTLKEIKTGKVGTIPNNFKYEKTGISPNGQTIFSVINQ